MPDSKGQKVGLKNQINRIFYIATLVATVCIGWAFNRAFADNLVGQASVVDGDTLEIHGTRIRLWGIDAPESTQLCRGDDSLQYRCGAKAANDLDGFIARRPVDCSPISLDRYGRMVATCTVGGIDLSEWLVRGGLALDWPQYSKRRYSAVQREAERAGRGLWAGSYIEPWLYRICIRAGGRPADCSDDANAHP
ncbi:thermonuclease family protein [Bradyrhizobium sp. ORS 111]|uniref:thermonuclease family protein n=1 Tax=Bradyrhizobium sp. ORS 111 TaxID=1685958 RepID=UPI003890FED2